MTKLKGSVQGIISRGRGKRRKHRETDIGEGKR